MNQLLLACESSCDETAFSLFDIYKNKILHSIINSQINIHEKNGGVIPDLAAHYHFKTILPLFIEITKEAAISYDTIDFFAATRGPGLPGALLIGYTFTKSLAWSLKKPFLGINHLEGHIYSPFLNTQTILFPHLCLSVSGGHTTLYNVANFSSYTKLAETRDDAAGECFDKIAKLLGLPYPGGKFIEEIAQNQSILKNVRKYPVSTLEDGSISFSGLKTAVLQDIMKAGYYDVTEKKIKPTTPKEFIIEVATSVQYVIGKMLSLFAEYHLKKHPKVTALSLVGGVACNQIIKNEFGKLTEKYNINFYFPEKKYCCDNADMIAFVAAQKIKEKRFHSSYQESIF